MGEEKMPVIVEKKTETRTMFYIQVPKSTTLYDLYEAVKKLPGSSYTLRESVVLTYESEVKRG